VSIPFDGGILLFFLLPVGENRPFSPLPAGEG
jgi:hypothetical protein